MNSIDYSAADGIRDFYGLLMDSCAEANQVFPKVECGDRVRFAVYGNQKHDVLYLLNTESTISQLARIH